MEFSLPRRRNGNFPWRRLRQGLLFTVLLVLVCAPPGRLAAQAGGGPQAWPPGVRWEQHG
jgi:hypothetical protein